MPEPVSSLRFQSGLPHDPFGPADLLTMKTQLKLVVVEDSVADAELLARHLAKAGLNCLINRVQTEDELIAALHRDKPDLILLDWNLPSVTGSEVLRRFKAGNQRGVGGQAQLPKVERGGRYPSQKW